MTSAARELVQEAAVRVLVCHIGQRELIRFDTLVRGFEAIPRDGAGAPRGSAHRGSARLGARIVRSRVMSVVGSHLAGPACAGRGAWIIGICRVV